MFSQTQVRTAGRTLGIEFLGVVPDLNLGRAAQVDAAVGTRHGLVVDEEFHIPEVLVRVGVGAVTVVDQFAFFDAPMLGEVRAHLFQRRLAFFTFESGGLVRVQTVPTGEVFSIEQGAKALGWFDFGGGGRQEGGEEQGDGKQVLHGLLGLTAKSAEITKNFFWDGMGCSSRFSSPSLKGSNRFSPGTLKRELQRGQCWTKWLMWKFMISSAWVS